MDGAPAFAIVRGTFRRWRSGGRCSLKIDLDLAHGAGNAVDGIPIEGLAIDAVGRRSLGTIQGDAHIVQFGVAVTLVLHRLGGVQGVDGVPTPRLRVGKAFGRLLNRTPQAIGQVVAQPPSLPPAIDKKHRDRGDGAPPRKTIQKRKRAGVIPVGGRAPLDKTGLAFLEGKGIVESARSPGSSKIRLRPMSSSSHSPLSAALRL